MKSTVARCCSGETPFGVLKWTYWCEQFVLRHRASCFECAERFRNGLPGKANQLGFWIEQIDVAWSAGHEKKNHTLGPRAKMRRLRCEGIGRPRGRSFARE